MFLENKVALITGSGRGIGRAIAQLFAEQGASVFLTARTEAQLASVATEIRHAGGHAEFATADLAHEKDCEKVVAAARAKFGRVDILVNNAGHYGPVVPVEEYPVAEFDTVVLDDQRKVKAIEGAEKLLEKADKLKVAGYVAKPFKGEQLVELAAKFIALTPPAAAA